MPFLYKFVGEGPRSIPEFGIDRVEPGETVETDRELDNPDFKPLKKAEVKEIKEAEKAADQPSSSSSKAKE